MDHGPRKTSRTVFHTAASQGQTARAPPRRVLWCRSRRCRRSAVSKDRPCIRSRFLSRHRFVAARPQCTRSSQHRTSRSLSRLGIYYSHYFLAGFWHRHCARTQQFAALPQVRSVFHAVPVARGYCRCSWQGGRHTAAKSGVPRGCFGTVLSLPNGRFAGRLKKDALRFRQAEAFSLSG